MIDFHSHILPGMDDGPQDVAESLAMLRQSFIQGVDLVVSTSHFYADEEFPREFLRRRKAAFRELQEAMLLSPEVYPPVLLGAEVLYFPGISEAEEMASLMIGNSRCILVEPPMAPWSNEMLSEIAAMGENFSCIPVIAHVDRFMHCLRDTTLIHRVRERNMAVQVNADYFLDPKTVKSAVKHLKSGHIQVIGSDCHNLTSRSQNLGAARRQARALGAGAEFDSLHKNSVDLILRRGEWK